MSGVPVGCPRPGDLIVIDGHAINVSRMIRTIRLWSSPGNQKDGPDRPCGAVVSGDLCAVIAVAWIDHQSWWMLLSHQGDLGWTPRGHG